MPEHISRHSLLHRVVAAGLVAASLSTAAGCAAMSTDSRPGSGSPAAAASSSPSSTTEESELPTPTPNRTQTDVPGGTDTYDVVTVGERCLATDDWTEHGISAGDLTMTHVAQRDVDSLLLVTIPAQSKAISNDATVMIDGSIYCFLDPSTLEPLLRFDLIARGFQVDLTGEAYKQLLATPDPIRYIYPD